MTVAGLELVQVHLSVHGSIWRYSPAHYYWHLHNLYNIFRNKWKCTKFISSGSFNWRSKVILQKKLFFQFTYCNFKEETGKNCMCSNNVTPLQYLVAHPLAVMTASKRFLQPSISFLHFSAGIFSHFFLCKLFKLLNVCKFPMPDFSSFQRFSIRLRSGLIAGHFKQSIFYFSTIPACFWMFALGLCLAGGPMIFTSNQVFLHWVGHFALKLLIIL